MVLFYSLILRYMLFLEYSVLEIKHLETLELPKYSVM
jgi:hypothetical protein